MSQEFPQGSEEVLHRLGSGPVKGGLWLAFTPSGHDRSRTWQMAVTERGRGSRLLATLLQTTALRPLATVTVRGHSYPLPIGWHERRRGGVVCFGGERKLGPTDGHLHWEMRWTADKNEPGRCAVEMRVQATPRRTGELRLSLHAPLHQPQVWSLGAAAGHGHVAQTVFSGYGGRAVRFVALEDGAGWDEETRTFEITLPKFPMGGGRLLRFGLGFGKAADAESSRAALVTQYAALAGDALHPLNQLPSWEPQCAAQRLLDPAGHAVQGAERLYFRSELWRSELRRPELGRSDAGPDVFHAGFPHYPLEALEALWDWHRLHPDDAVPPLVRYGATGIAADFQVMGQGDSEPNKGAFWDRLTGGVGADFAGEPTHGIAANARIAGSLFRLHDAVGCPLLRQSALNICQWLLLKMNERGWYDGARVRATQGLNSDGRVIPQVCALDGMEAVRPLVRAYRATCSEVFVKAAWKLANTFLETRAREFESASPPVVAAVIQSLLALDAEAPNARLRVALASWGAWLRALPLLPDSPALNADGLHSGLYDCALAGFALCAFFRDPAYARFAWAALSHVPPASRACAWRELALAAPALLAVASALPDARVDFDAMTVTVGWRTYAPDAATDQYVRVQSPDGSPVHSLPLVSRHEDQLLLLVLAPHSAPDCVSVFKNGRRPIARDLLSGALDSETRLHAWGAETWARIGIFTVDP